jgi:hypothetical protein
MNAEMDVRHVLPVINVPTLILHSVGDMALDVGGGRYMAGQIPGAKYVELPGNDHLPWLSDSDAVLGEVEEFLTGVRHGPEPERILATVLFTDIVGSTERAAALGDRRWRDLLDGQRDRAALSAHRGGGLFVTIIYGLRWTARAYRRARNPDAGDRSASRYGGTAHSECDVAATTNTASRSISAQTRRPAGRRGRNSGVPDGQGPGGSPTTNAARSP